MVFTIIIITIVAVIFANTNVLRLHLLAIITTGGDTVNRARVVRRCWHLLAVNLHLYLNLHLHQHQ